MSFAFVLAAFYLASLLISNVVSGKLLQVGDFILPGATFLFALTFTLRDAVHVVGGFKFAKDLIWVGFGANALLVGYTAFVLAMPSPAFFDPSAYETVFGTTWRVVFASFVAYLVSTALDTLVFEKYKNSISKRILVSNLLSTSIDSLLFVSIAFAGTGVSIVETVLTVFVAKFFISLLAIPLVEKAKLWKERN